MEKRQQWGSKIGFILAAVGSAVGLGNFWRFPYVTGVSGGALFILIYVLCVTIIGIPVLCAELLIGKRNQKNAVDSLKHEFPGKPYELAGWLGLLTGVLILGFYIVISAWCLYYLYASILGDLAFKSTTESESFFASFTTNNFMPLIFIILFMILNIGILNGGVKKGIELASKILMPVLFLIVLILIVRALTLSNGVNEGLEFMFKPDFSNLSWSVVIGALGLAFFKLSLGMGTMITYGSYLKKDDRILKSSIQIAFFDTLIAILAGIAIFPTVFAFGYEPNAGVALAFHVIPTLIQTLPLGYLFSVLFFLALTVAALTSSISMFEVIVAFFVERFKQSRTQVLLYIFLIVTSLSCVVSITFNQKIQLFNLDLFSLLDQMTSLFFLPIGGFIIVVAVGWSLKRSEFNLEFGDTLTSQILHFLIKYLSPLIILIIFIFGLIYS